MRSKAPNAAVTSVAMQQSESGGGAATSEVQLNDQPSALIACKVPEEVFNEQQLKVGVHALCVYLYYYPLYLNSGT